MIRRGNPDRERAGTRRDYPGNVIANQPGFRTGVMRSVPQHIQEILATADVSEVRDVLALGALATQSVVTPDQIDITGAAEGDVLTVGVAQADWETP